MTALEPSSPDNERQETGLWLWHGQGTPAKRDAATHSALLARPTNYQSPYLDNSAGQMAHATDRAGDLACAHRARRMGHVVFTA